MIVPLTSGSSKPRRTSSAADARMRAMSYLLTPLPATAVNISPEALQTRMTNMAHHAGEPTFLVGAQGIDREELLRVIRENASRRRRLPHAAAALGQARMHEERQDMLDGLRQL